MKGLSFSIFALVLIALFSQIDAQTPDFDLELRGGKPKKADWEAGLRTPSGNPVSTGHHEWVSGDHLHWKLDFDSPSQVVTFFWGLDGNQPNAYLNSINANVVLSSKNSLKLWTKNSNKIGTNGSMVTDLVTFSNNGNNLNLPSLSVTGPNQFKEFIIPENISGSFTLSGRTTLTWDGPKPPKGSHAQLHVTTGDYNSVPVPEPTTYFLIGLAALLVASMRRRKILHKTD